MRRQDHQSEVRAVWSRWIEGNDAASRQMPFSLEVATLLHENLIFRKTLSVAIQQWSAQVVKPFLIPYTVKTRRPWASFLFETLGWASF